MKKIIFTLAIASVAIFAVLGSLSVNHLSEQVETQSENKIPKAAIIDQLYYDVPNIIFHKQATKILENAGYEVEIFTTQDITIDFYKKLPSQNFDFVIVRTHGATDKADHKMVTLFTGEKYQEDKYISEQLFGQAKRVTPLYEITYDTTEESEWVIVNDTYKYKSSPVMRATNSTNEYFAITPKLIDDALEGKFSGTTFVLAGCNTMDSNSMAEALKRKGATAVVGWEGQLLSTENDIMIIHLLEKLFVSNEQLPNAVDSIMNDFSDSWFHYNTRMKFFV